MHEFKHGELETSRGRKVKNPKQAIAIGLREAGASKYESKEKIKKPSSGPRRASDARQPKRTVANETVPRKGPVRNSMRRPGAATFQVVQR
jgi:hypothetical protein